MTTPSRMLRLLSAADNEVTEVEEVVAVQSLFIRNMLQDTCNPYKAPLSLPLPSSVIRKVFDFCRFQLQTSLNYGIGGDGDGDGDGNGNGNDFCRLQPQPSHNGSTSNGNGTGHCDGDGVGNDNHSNIKHPNSPAGDVQSPSSANDFFSALTPSSILIIMKAADYLLIDDLLDECASKVAELMLKGKSPEQMRREYGLPQDLTIEEVRQIKRRNTWIAS
ncbi:hypothetical protein GOP47_0014958 [Adiantum capillus-veneris]|uniref:SKP1-like protein n=1 Tax=Adiantum capillus-veneris TaxID=13818 RepID=A0A9D4ZER1_ADICA|nr:hypothetical protein GOP47_0014958 [Adiantum capillus-veneris]